MFWKKKKKNKRRLSFEISRGWGEYVVWVANSKAMLGEKWGVVVRRVRARE